jgi:tryptophan 2,3-dioxygenase
VIATPSLADLEATVRRLAGPGVVGRLAAAGPDEDQPEAVALAAAFRRQGKAHAPAAWLDALEALAAALATTGVEAYGRRVWDAFLSVLLDKRRGAYDYNSYLALDLLQLATEPWPDGAADRWPDVLLALLGDVLLAELRELARSPADEETSSPRAAALRRRVAATLGSAAAYADLGRASLPAPGPPRASGEPRGLDGASSSELERLGAELAGRPRHRFGRLLPLTLVPVDRLHDEHMFIRVLQSFECVFALVVQQLEQAACALADGDDPPGVRHMDAAADVLARTTRLFQVLATLDVDAFRAFRQHTVGASAIQSARFKRLEVLCSEPGPDRLRSAAFRFVALETVRPERSTLEDLILRRTRARPAGRDELLRAAREIDDRYVRWKRMHISLATRMLGHGRGTGYTEGVPYLQRFADDRLFPRLAVS